MLITVTMLLAGLALLFVGGESLVRGAVALAARMRLSPFVIGLTVVGFETSTPELLVSVSAALKGSPDIAMGNVVGSNIANILLIVGVSAAIAPVALSLRPIARDLAVMTASTALLLLFAWLGMIDRWTGLAMFAALIGYLVWAIRAGAPADISSAGLPGKGEPLGTPATAGLLAGGLAGLMLGATWLVDSATQIARAVGLSEAVIGLTIVAVGTSLPELATSIIAAFRKQGEVALGNVIGSNIFNVLAILGATATIAPLTVADSFAAFDAPIALAATLALVAVIAFAKGLWRWTGAAFLIAYVAYIAALTV